jgi:hypothetical protein
MQFEACHILYLQEKLPIEQLINRNVPDGEPVKPPALDDTPFTFVEDLKTLEVLATKMKNATEFAVSVLVSWRCHCTFFWHIGMLVHIFQLILLVSWLFSYPSNLVGSYLQRLIGSRNVRGS